MNNHLQFFENENFGQIRTVIDGSKVMFCGSDVAKALGYKRPSDAISTHCRYTVKRSIPHPQAADKEIEMLFIPEGDIYRLTARSDLPGAEQFESWIFDEVIPSIRQTGAYMTSRFVDMALNNPEALIEILQDMKEKNEKIHALQTENKAQAETIQVQDQLIGEFKPKVKYYDTIISSVDTMAIGQIATDYGLSAQQLNKILEEEGVQYKLNRQWILKKAYRNLGYTESYTHTFVHRSGESGSQLFTRWTQKGRVMIHHLLERRGILALMDRDNKMS